MSEAFRRFAQATSYWMGLPSAFVLATAACVVWAVSGPIFGFSDTWQLVINTGTTVLTFLAVFLIQNTQNRDAKAMHLKLDELLRSAEGARNRLVDLEELTDEQLDELQEEFHRIHKRENGKPREELDERGKTATERDDDRERAGSGRPRR